jgi:hypothetical protein
VESDLVVGDIKSGQMCEVVYRSAWASAAGAFELLNPATVGSIELGASTDTTLTRSAAGVMAVEGNVVPSPSSQAQYDMLVRGASSWSRLAIGTAGQLLVVRSGTPTWSNASTFDTVKTATDTPTAVSFTSIPSWVREIDVLFDSLSLSGSDDILVQLGTSGGMETSSYVSSGAYTGTSSNADAQAYTAGFGVWNGLDGAGGAASGIMTIKNITGNVWVASYSMCGNSGAVYTGSGIKTLAGTLDRLQVNQSGSNTFDGGTINICYR